MKILKSNMRFNLQQYREPKENTIFHSNNKNQKKKIKKRSSYTIYMKHHIMDLVRIEINKDNLLLLNRFGLNE